MSKKKCSQCLDRKELSAFSKCAANKDGLQYKCRECCDRYALENRPRFRARISAYDASRRISHRAKIAAQQAAYGIKNRAKLNAYNARYHAENHKKILARKKIYVEQNRDRINAERRARYRSAPLHALILKLRARTWEAFRNKKWFKGGGSEKLLGCTWAEARSHIESKFRPGMSWGDGSFEIDHIVPLASARTPDELAALCRYTNLQPLPMSENRRKSDKIDFFIAPSTAEQST